MAKGIRNKRYTGEFKQRVVETMMQEKLSYREAARQFDVNSDHRVASWERIYLEEGPDGTELILHSDQGWQYQHKQYQRMLETKGIRKSMSRKGNCLDNAVMENFFGLLKTELFYLQDFDSIEHFKAELIDYLDYYNRRIKLKLKGLTPAQHRSQTLQVA